ncbi:MAG: RecX family transcriptional regulator [Thermoanaerobaculaceae bacterium]|nr:RecX family transcriptional regulator [Thermoanaerobaculaceae bacterium]
MTDDIHEVALRMVARRSLSAREVKERLAKRGFSAPAVAAEVRRLERAGLLDDAALAAALVATEVRRGRGRRGVAATLRRRRLGPQAVEEALATVSEEEERTALAVAVAAATRRSPGWWRLPEGRRKVVRYLLARGFGARLVREAVAAAREGGADDAANVEPGVTEDLS